jgi:hypothetical protein
MKALVDNKIIGDEISPPDIVKNLNIYRKVFVLFPSPYHKFL